jgi:excisionase family DNA binding protein
MTVKQVAERLGCSVSLVYSFIEEKRLPCLRLGREGCRGKILIHEEDLKKFVESLPEQK